MSNQHFEVVDSVLGTWIISGNPDQVRAIAEEFREMETKRGLLVIQHLPATTDRGLRALATKALYAARNWIGSFPGGRVWMCRREGYMCEWVYPYGWVPEAGCPRHD